MMHSPCRSGSARRRSLWRAQHALQLVGALALLVGTGCTSSLSRWGPDHWVADYDTAEQRVRESDRELLIFYRNTGHGMDESMEKALKSDPLKGHLTDYVCCISLHKSYEPDRCYVAQFGVERAPALIVVHRDGTYHARTGRMSAGEIAEFLAAAQPPGAQPVINPHIPRQPRYHWHRSIEAAEEEALQTGRPVCIVFYRSLSRDWRRLKKLLSRHEVYLRLADMVHCRIGLFKCGTGILPVNPRAGSPCHTKTRFGVLQLPALVIARPDGTYDVLELPTSYETIVRFADAAEDTHRPNDAGAALSAAGASASGGP